MLKIKEEIFSKVLSECPQCQEQNTYWSKYSLHMDVITQKCEVCGHEYQIEVI